MEKTYDVLCVGLVVANIPLRPVDKTIFDVDITTVEKIDILPGGDAMNEAIILSRLGNRTGLVGMVGRDYFSEILFKFTRESGVDISNVKIADKINTSVCVVLINRDGRRNFCTYKGANRVFSIDDIDLSVVRATTLINIGGLFALPKFNGEGAETLFKEARRRGVVTAADTKYDMYKIGFDGIRGMLRYTDYFMPSYDEAAHITGERKPERMAEFFLDAGVKNVVIKLGGSGCYLRSASEAQVVTAFKADAIDTTGAGDNFVAAFLTGLLKGWGFERCGRFANAAGALSTTKIGAVTAVQCMEQVLEFENNTIRE